MKKVAKLKGLVSPELQLRWLEAGESDREGLREVIRRERAGMIERQARKGYRLEATVAEVYGVFTRGVAAGTLRACEVEEAAAPAGP